MEKPKSLDKIFKDKIFRIPDYQRGYAWQLAQLKDFWEDLVNLAEDRHHYTGVLTLKEEPEIKEDTKEFWLVDDYSYQLYHIVDGQQRLTTFVVFLQSFIDCIKSLPENKDKQDDQINVTENLSVSEIKKQYLFKTKPSDVKFRTYKFGYTEDNPSDKYLRHRILGEPDSGSVDETFYTLNLSNANKFFLGKIKEVYEKENKEGLQTIYKKLVKRFLFNEYIIQDELDVYVAFETMNNRGKNLSNLELLKNRLIYITTLYNDNDLDKAGRVSLRNSINAAWKEIYRQLGRYKQHPLNDDDFLQAHWRMSFQYSRQKANEYINFLLNEKFSPKNVCKRKENEVALERVEEVLDITEIDDDINEIDGKESLTNTEWLPPKEILEYVDSLKASVVYWFKSFHPRECNDIAEDEALWLERLNRLGMVYFRPLIMSVLKNIKEEENRIKLYKHIERFIFIVFKLSKANTNYQNSKYYKAARDLDRGKLNPDELIQHLDESADYLFENGCFNETEFHTILIKKFKNEAGYYSWNGIRYFLYEYERHLLSESRQSKVNWESLLISKGDKISIEHIYPQTETKEWAVTFKGFSDLKKKNCSGSLGNLLLLSLSINSSLQNDSFLKKKAPKYDEAGKKLRNGYSDGSHSEIEVSSNEEWNQEKILERGIKLLDFMERRWDIKFASNEVKEQLLFLNTDS